MPSITFTRYKKLYTRYVNPGHNLKYKMTAITQIDAKFFFVIVHRLVQLTECRHLSVYNDIAYHRHLASAPPVVDPIFGNMDREVLLRLMRTLVETQRVAFWVHRRAVEYSCAWPF